MGILSICQMDTWHIYIHKFIYVLRENFVQGRLQTFANGSSVQDRRLKIEGLGKTSSIQSPRLKIPGFKKFSSGLQSSILD